MKIEQIYTGCLAQAAYYIESNGEAAIFDPLREVDPYIAKAAANNAKIKFIFETHFHADFVSGHLDLRKKTGASIVYGPLAAPDFDAIIAEDGQEFQIGSCIVRAIHTPGHTMESTCYLLFDENKTAVGIITGDTLFIGDVGRPDLAQSLMPGLTQEILAGHLYDSLREKILPLPDELIVYPSHGAGSACGKNMSKETTDTLGNQKRTNYALRDDLTRDEFIRAVLDGLAPPPAYFPQNVLLNVKGYTSLDVLLKKGLQFLSPEEFEEKRKVTGATILDVRHENDFVKSHIPGAVFIGIHGNFAPWVGALLRDVNTPLLLVAPEGKEEETITRLSRVGFDQVLGFLKGGIDAWTESGFETAHIPSITPQQFAQNLQQEDVVVDARKCSEFSSGHLPGALNIALDDIHQRIEELPGKPFFLHCAGGYRSVIMASLLKKYGNHHAINVEQGMSGIKTTKLPIEISQAVN